MVELLDAAARAGEAADEIVLLNAREVGHSARQIHASLLWLIAVTSALTAAVVAGAVLLLRHALDGAAKHTAILQEHADEMAAFAGRAAHELRAPLQTLMLAIHAARGGRRDALDRADAATRRLRDTISEILEFSCAGASATAVSSAVVASVVDEVAEELAQPAADASIVVEREVEPGLEVAMAPGHLRTVLRNLVGNAIKYAGGSAGARVSVVANRGAARAEVIVSDNGPGIAPEALLHVFEPFYRATRRPGGYGLGLAMVKRLVEAHGGRVTIASENGCGTKVFLVLPGCSGPERRNAGPVLSWSASRPDE